MRRSTPRIVATKKEGTPSPSRIRPHYGFEPFGSDNVNRALAQRHRQGSGPSFVERNMSLRSIDVIERQTVLGVVHANISIRTGRPADNEIVLALLAFKHAGKHLRPEGIVSDPPSALKH